jgi:hypothetical protein
MPSDFKRSRDLCTGDLIFQEEQEESQFFCFFKYWCSTVIHFKLQCIFQVEPEERRPLSYLEFNMIKISMVSENAVSSKDTFYFRI